MLKKSWKYYLPLLIFAVIFAFFWRGLSLNPHALPSVLINKPAPDFRLPTLLTAHVYKDQRIFSKNVTLLNVWASWCDTCAEEQAFLLTLKTRYPHLQLVGLDFQDQPKKARLWLNAHGNPYHLVLNDEKGVVGVDYGVYGTPESFLIDAQGVILAKVTGVLNEKAWQEQMARYILLSAPTRGKPALVQIKGGRDSPP